MRLYEGSYLGYEFPCLVKNGIHIPQYVVRLRTFSNGIRKPFQLKQQLTNARQQLKDKNSGFWGVTLSNLKGMNIDESESYQQTNISIMLASYAVALHVAKAKKPHMTGESLLKTCIAESVRLVLEEEASQKMKRINTITKRRAEISENIKENMV